MIYLITVPTVVNSSMCTTYLHHSLLFSWKYTDKRYYLERILKIWILTVDTLTLRSYFSSLSCILDMFFAFHHDSMHKLNDTIKSCYCVSIVCWGWLQVIVCMWMSEAVTRLLEALKSPVYTLTVSKLWALLENVNGDTLLHCIIMPELWFMRSWKILIDQNWSILKIKYNRCISDIF